ncbi:MAG: hypothetical protein ACOYME_05845 [Prochlorotrichaceae cyanobacterium]|jgi:hypothetical protein
MFPFPFMPCCFGDEKARTEYRDRQLDFLRWMRDSLETRLSAVNAAISTLERQSRPEETPAQF